MDPQPPDLRGRLTRDQRPRPRRRTGWTGSHSPTRSPPTRARAASTPAAAGSAHPATRASTPRCCYPRSASAIPADDPRSLATVRAFAVELTQDGYAYRYQPDERPLGEAEGAFLLCGFSSHARISKRATRPNRRGGSSAPERLRTARASRRGVRRHPTSAAREPPQPSSTPGCSSAQPSNTRHRISDRPPCPGTLTSVRRRHSDSTCSRAEGLVLSRANVSRWQPRRTASRSRSAAIVADGGSPFGFDARSYSCRRPWSSRAH